MPTAELFVPASAGWFAIRGKIASLENEAFGTGAFTEAELGADFSDPANIAVLLKTDADDVIGFAYAKPFEPETDDSPAQPGETAWIWNIVIQKEFRGRGLAGSMLAILEEELKRRGFAYLEMNARVADNFAGNISKRYKDKIIKTFPLDSRWGPQVFFRIKL